jgi:hypothetical protein
MNSSGDNPDWGANVVVGGTAVLLGVAEDMDNAIVGNIVPFSPWLAVIIGVFVELTIGVGAAILGRGNTKKYVYPTSKTQIELRTTTTIDINIQKFFSCMCG